MTDIIKLTLENLNKNGMETFFAENRAEALNIVKALIKEGETVGFGGSVTLNEVGTMNELRSGKYSLLDRDAPDITPAEAEKIMKQSLLADVYITSSNAVTQNGEIYNVDGRGNRLAALSFGPDRVIIVVGVNKIVSDLAAAEKRVKVVAAPKNALRLGLKTPCSVNGECISLKGDNPVCTAGCNGENRICRNYLILGKQKNDGRIKVVVCNEVLGY